MPPLNVLPCGTRRAAKAGQYFGLFFDELERQCIVVAGVEWSAVWALRRPQCMACERDTGVVDLAADLPGDAPPTQAKALATSERTSSLS
jgi:hypothetical protein